MNKKDKTQRGRLNLYNPLIHNQSTENAIPDSENEGIDVYWSEGMNVFFTCI